MSGSPEGRNMNQKLPGALLLAAMAVACTGAPSSTPTQTTSSAIPSSPSAAPFVTPAARTARPTVTTTAVPSRSPSPIPTRALADTAEITFDRLDVPDGRWDGFVIHSIRADGTDDRVVLRGEHEGPRWSPDGQHLLVA